MTVSSVLAFRALRGFRRERFGGWPRLDWMFFAEVLILSLVVIAMASPFIWKRSSPLALVIDNSAAMQALTPSGKTRFDIAREKLDAELSAENGGGEISVYVTAPQPRRVAPPFITLTEARLALRRIKPTDAPNDQTTLENFLSNLASEARVAKVIFAGADALATPVPARIHPIAVGDAVANAAIGSFTLRREVLGAEALHASLTIANFSAETRTLDLVVTGDRKEVAHARGARRARDCHARVPQNTARTYLPGETRPRRRARARQRCVCDGRLRQERVDSLYQPDSRRRRRAEFDSRRRGYRKKSRFIFTRRARQLRSRDF